MNIRQWLLPLLVFLRRVVVGCVVIYTVICFTLGGTDYAKPTFQLLALAWLLLLTLMQWRRRTGENSTVAVPQAFWHRALRGGEIIATNIALALLLGELALRALAAFTGQSLVVSNSLAAYRLVPGRDYGHGLRGNQLGYPGRDFVKKRQPGVFRIAALGDSFAVGPAVPFADNYLTQLEKRMPKTEVLNFGVSAAGPREYLTILQKDVLPYQPDLVLLSIFVGNDITEQMATPRHLAPDGHSLYLLCIRGWRIAREQQRKQNHASTNDRLQSPPLSPKTFGQIEARRLQVCRIPVEPNTEKKWQRTFQSLEQIANACSSRGVPLAVVLIPDEFQVNPAVLKQAQIDVGLTSSDIELSVPQRRLLEWFAKKAPCLDLLPAFRGKTDLYAPHDTHWNRAGNHLGAREIVAWLMGMKVQ